MKINKAKLLVGTLAIASVAATVGSISGTVAWFQYSTRSTVEYQGASAHCSESLQVRLYHAASADPEVAEFKTDWKSDLSIADVQSYIRSGHARGAADYKLYPVTTGPQAANAFPTTFYKNPIYQYSAEYAPVAPAVSRWRAADVHDYIDLPLQFRVVDIDGQRDAGGDYKNFLAKKVYLSDLTIADTSESPKLDITPAIRVAFDATNEGIFSINGGNVSTSGNLDLNGDGILDKEKGYSWDTRADFVYGTTGNASSYQISAAAAGSHLEIADDSDPENIVGTELGTTAAASVGLAVNVRIYLEGWQTLSTTVAAVDTGYVDLAALKDEETGIPTGVAGTYYKTGDGRIYKWSGSAYVEVTGGKEEIAVWNDVEFVGASFNIGMRFTAEAHTDHHA